MKIKTIQRAIYSTNSFNIKPIEDCNADDAKVIRKKLYSVVKRHKNEIIDINFLGFRSKERNGRVCMLFDISIDQSTKSTKRKLLEMIDEYLIIECL